MTSKLMTLAFVGALALSALTPNALARSKGNAHSPSATAVGRGKRLPPQLVSKTSGAAVGSHAINGKRK